MFLTSFLAAMMLWAFVPGMTFVGISRFCFGSALQCTCIIARNRLRLWLVNTEWLLMLGMFFWNEPFLNNRQCIIGFALYYFLCHFSFRTLNIFNLYSLLIWLWRPNHIWECGSGNVYRYWIITSCMFLLASLWGFWSTMLRVNLRCYLPLVFMIRV